MNNTIEELNNKSFKYRKRFLELFSNVGFGHLTSAFSCTEILNILMNEIIYDGIDFNSKTIFDRIVISKGHGAGIYYPILEDLNLITHDALDDLIKIGGKKETFKKFYLPAFDFYGGSLGIGIGVASGLAISDKLSNNNKKTFCLIGDGECYEGSVWEANMFAGANELSNLYIIVDRNQLSCSDFTEHMLKIEPLREKFNAFNFETIEINGHDLKELYNAFVILMSSKSNKPKCIIANTEKGHGLDYTLNKPLMHGYMPNCHEVSKAYKELKHY